VNRPHFYYYYTEQRKHTDNERRRRHLSTVIYIYYNTHMPIHNIIRLYRRSIEIFSVSFRPAIGILNIILLLRYERHRRTPKSLLIHI